MIKIIYFDFLNVIATNDNDRRLIEYIKVLKNKFKIGLISNSSKGEIKRILKDDLNFFDIVIISSELNMIKPSKEIFEYAILKADCRPEEILFFDDGINNIESAKEVGINAVLYTDFENFLKDIAPSI